VATGEDGSLYRIPIVDWVLRTSAKMKQKASEERTDWRQFWSVTYRELGGQRSTCGDKPCPRAAAYGLWFLGRIPGSGRPRLNWTVPAVREQLGKNATYAVIAADLYAKAPKQSPRDTWQAVHREFEKQTGEEAGSEQGAVKVAMALAAQGLLS